MMFRETTLKPAGMFGMAGFGLLVSLLAPVASQACDLAADASCSDKRLEVTVSQLGEVFAVKGDAVVTENDIDAYLAERVPPGHRSPFLMDPDRIADMLRNLTAPRQLARLAIDADLHERPEVQARLLLELSNVLASEYAEWYAARHELDDYQAVAREDFLRSDRQTPATVDFTQLMIAPESGNLLEAMREVVDLADRLESDPSAFDKLVVEHSDDPAVEENQGAYRDIQPSNLVDPVRDALAGLEPGELSGVVQSQYGLHILRLDAVEPARPAEFDDVRGRMLEQARANHRELLKGRLMSELDAHELRIRENAVRELLERYDSGFGIFNKTE